MYDAIDAMRSEPTPTELLEAILYLKELTVSGFGRTEVRFDAIEGRLQEHDRRFDAIERRLGRIETRVEDLEQRLPA